jgi:hypothetical protein
MWDLSAGKTLDDIESIGIHPADSADKAATSIAEAEYLVNILLDHP